jgi:hypothetical protein
MMRKILKQMQSFIMFDIPVSTQHIGSLFSLTHYHHLTSISNWSFGATRKKIIAKYWFQYVLVHFCILVGSAAILSLPFINVLDKYYLPIFFLVAAISFLVLFAANYWPSYYSDFLPKLDSLVDEYEKRQADKLQEQRLIELQRNLAQEHELRVTQLENNLAKEYEQLATQREELAKERQQIQAMQQEQVKCRKEQFSTASLALIFYVLDKTSGMNRLQCNDESASSLTKLFGKRFYWHKK